MEYILFSFAIAGIQAVLPKYIEKIMQLTFLLTFLILYYINGWKTAEINVGLFICWYALWNVVLDYCIKALERRIS